MLTRFLTALLLTSSTCSIICGTACDLGDVGECAGPAGMFGPCDDGICTGDLFCLQTQSGNVCAPPSTSADSAEQCGAWLGGSGVNCDNVGLCLVECSADDQCLGDSVCDEHLGTCVHPVEKKLLAGCGEEGGLFGPCPPDSHICDLGLICLDSLPTGTICGIDSGVATEEQAACGDQFGWALDCSFFNADCQLACASDADCSGGTVCSTLYGACVWPQ